MDTISFASTLWEAVSAVGVFFFGLIIISYFSKWFGVNPKYSLSLYLWHSIFCIAYIIYSMIYSGDAINYFLHSLRWNLSPRVGTRFVVYFNSLFTQGLHLSYGGCFLVYNIIGSIGLIAFFKALQSTLYNKTINAQKLIFLVPFLPGLSFWTTAIGKDSISFCSIGLICWASAKPVRYAYVILICLFIMLLVRPHVAGFLSIALAIAYTTSKDHSFKSRLLIGSVLWPVCIFCVFLAIDYIGLEANLSKNSVEAYIEKRQTYNLQGGSSIDLAGSPFLIRLFSYLFRPLFFDAGGLLGLVVSFENLLVLGLFIYSALGFRFNKSNLPHFQKTFFFWYSALCWMVLANTTSNLGIAIRQKAMFTPMVIILIVSYFPNQNRRKMAAVPVAKTIRE